MSGQTDAYGNTIQKMIMIVVVIKLLQTPAQTMATQLHQLSRSFSKCSNRSFLPEDTDDPLYKKKEQKRRGRSPTILTGVTGATGGLTLGKKSLLGIS